MTTFYAKRGRRYHPVQQYDGDLLDSLPKGAHLIVVEPGIRSTLHNIDPKTAPLLAALRKCRDPLLAAIREAAKVRPSEELKGRRLGAWEAYKAVAHPDDLLVVRGGSHHDIVDALERALIAQEAAAPHPDESFAALGEADRLEMLERGYGK